MFCLRIRSGAKSACKVLNFSLSAYLMLCVLMLCVLNAVTPGQAGLSKPSGSSGDLYGGIELSDEGVKAIALEVSQGDEDAVPRLIYREVTRLSLGRTTG